MVFPAWGAFLLVQTAFFAIMSHCSLLSHIDAVSRIEYHMG